VSVILIISLDSDKKFQKTLEMMIKQIVPSAKYESFSSVFECYECLKKDVTVALLMHYSRCLMPLLIAVHFLCITIHQPDLHF